ncbi:ubiquitin carboxyl-terminal hydrolase 27-like [Hydractinia symbiolongicarpus]|uniref:ubiquitin carboxyl-terminal hydrolase 27-like n=1 Tax=Hydractinia symbiolongicarpus TaxID=13093 RepID=UPI00254DBF06|nr:ubiquitin carboxyl-terminal hydrolase 27-like [Hydractinia symbiolongicarpus]
MEIVNSGSHLIVQLKRFIMSNGHISKQVLPVSCFPDFLSLPLTIGPEVRSRKHFKIRALINHSGSLNNGHYTAIVQDQKTDQWLHCNDRAVTQCDVRKELYSKLSYVFFFQAV